MKKNPRIGFFITCLADLFQPAVGFASIRLLNRAGCQVEVPEGQTCCGQIAWNNGDAVNARALAKQVIEKFAGFDYVVAPSGSCANMLKNAYPELLADDPDWAWRAADLSQRSFELTSFLVSMDITDGSDATDLSVETLFDDFPATPVITYHDSCTGLRRLDIRDQPRSLLRKINGIHISELPHPGVCCGFGGSFCVKYPDISVRMVSNKVENIRKIKADVLLGGDLGCLLNIAGRLQRLEVPCRVYHVAEVLAGMVEKRI